MCLLYDSPGHFWLCSANITAVKDSGNNYNTLGKPSPKILVLSSVEQKSWHQVSVTLDYIILKTLCSSSFVQPMTFEEVLAQFKICFSNSS